MLIINCIIFYIDAVYIAYFWNSVDRWLYRLKPAFSALHSVFIGSNKWHSGPIFKPEKNLSLVFFRLK